MHSTASRPLRVWLPAVRAGSGSDVYVQRLADGLRRAGHLPVVQWLPRAAELCPWAIKSVKAPSNIDVIHANSWQGFACRRKGVPMIVTEHHFVLDPAFAPYRRKLQSAYHRVLVSRWVRKSMANADAIVAVSHHTAQAIYARLGRSAHVIHNWLEANMYAGSAGYGEVDDPEKQKFRLLFVGNPSRRKGSDVIEPLARRLGDAFDIWCLGGLRHSVAHGPSMSNVHHIARVSPERMPELYQRVDAVLVPARYEAFGYVSLEAMACAKPVVGFDSTGTAEVCRNEQTALLSPVDDLDALCHNCWRLTKEPGLARRLGSAGQARAREHFSEGAAISRYLALYHALLR